LNGAIFECLRSTKRRRSVPEYADERSPTSRAMTLRARSGVDQMNLWTALSGTAQRTMINDRWGDHHDTVEN
jgi:hypothetical protein